MVDRLCARGSLIDQHPVVLELRGRLAQTEVELVDKDRVITSLPPAYTAGAVSTSDLRQIVRVRPLIGLAKERTAKPATQRREYLAWGRRRQLGWNQRRGLGKRLGPAVAHDRSRVPE